jgi:hypothetical protein
MEQVVVPLPLGNFKPNEFHRIRIMVLSLTRCKFDRKAFLCWRNASEAQPNSCIVSHFDLKMAMREAHESGFKFL